MPNAPEKDRRLSAEYHFQGQDLPGEVRHMAGMQTIR